MSYDDIFQTDAPDDKREQVQEISLAELHTYKDHPFRVIDDDAMQKTAESIQQYGVLVPGLVRPRIDGGYEIIAGHRRKRGCELADLETMPVIIRDLDDDEATIIMVDSNLQRETLLFSELAFAYKMKLEAIKRQAGRPPKNPTQVGQELKGKLSIEIVAEQSGESRNQIQRYIRLTSLIPDLLQLVDDKRMAFNPAVDISFLTDTEQADLLDSMTKYQSSPSLSQAQRMKKLSQDGSLASGDIDAILSEEKQEAKKVTISGDSLKKYFPSSYSLKQIEDTIIKLLDSWQKNQQSQHLHGAIDK